MAPMSKEHDNELVSNERLNAPRVRGQVRNAATMIASELGVTSAPAAPCSARAATSRLIDGASAHASEKAPKAAIPVVNARRAPQTSPTEPPSRISEPSESRYALATHC
jgi:hypothetical protein